MWNLRKFSKLMSWLWFSFEQRGNAAFFPPFLLSWPIQMIRVVVCWPFKFCIYFLSCVTRRHWKSILKKHQPGCLCFFCVERHYRQDDCRWRPTGLFLDAFQLQFLFSRSHNMWQLIALKSISKLTIFRFLLIKKNSVAKLRFCSVSLECKTEARSSISTWWSTGELYWTF